MRSFGRWDKRLSAGSVGSVNVRMNSLFDRRRGKESKGGVESKTECRTESKDLGQGVLQSKTFCSHRGVSRGGLEDGC